MPAPDEAKYNPGVDNSLATQASVQTRGVVPTWHLSTTRRALQMVVSDVASLASALADASVNHIVITAGHYALNHTQALSSLSVTRAVTIEAAIVGTVVLDAQATSSSPRRVFEIDSGSSGVVHLIGLNITGGYLSSNVSVALLVELS